MLFRKNESGTSAVEFAIVAPVFLVLMLGMFGYGIYFGAVHSVQQLSASAARASIAGLDQQERVALAQEYVATASDNYPMLTKSKIVTEASTPEDDPNSFQVAVSYDSSSLPIFSMSNLIPVPATVIRRVSVIKRGGY